MLSLCVWFAFGSLCEVVSLFARVGVVMCLCVLFMMYRVVLYSLLVLAFVCLVACF